MKKILVACEESQAVTKEFRRLGHEAYSCDIIPCSGGHPEWHIQADVTPLLNGHCSFETSDEAMHTIHGCWDMIIAHPPCTYLSNAGATRLRINGRIEQSRMQKAIEAKNFFMRFYDSDCEKICIENPVPQKIHGLPPYTQIIQPYEHGDPWMKRTCLWLRGLPLLWPSGIVVPEGKWVQTTAHGRAARPGEWATKGKHNPKERSKTFSGIARAMAEQWG